MGGPGRGGGRGGRYFSAPPGRGMPTYRGKGDRRMGEPRSPGEDVERPQPRYV